MSERRLKSTAVSAGKTIAVFVVLAVVLSACASNGTPSSSPRSQAGLPAVLEDVRRNPDQRGSAEVYCRASIAKSPSDFPYKAFFAGLFSVPREEGGKAFCAALIEAVIAGDLTEQNLVAFRNRRDRSDRAPLGALLRDLMIAHLRMTTQEAALK